MAELIKKSEPHLVRGSLAFWRVDLRRQLSTLLLVRGIRIAVPVAVTCRRWAMVISGLVLFVILRFVPSQHVVDGIQCEDTKGLVSIGRIGRKADAVLTPVFNAPLERVPGKDENATIVFAVVSEFIVSRQHIRSEERRVGKECRL